MSAPKNPRPEVGKAYKLGDELIVPTYVSESELPRGDGACVGADSTVGATFKPAGWYVEFRYVGYFEQYRRFIPFERAS